MSHECRDAIEAVVDPLSEKYVKEDTAIVVAVVIALAHALDTRLDRLERP